MRSLDALSLHWVENIFRMQKRNRQLATKDASIAFNDLIRAVPIQWCKGRQGLKHAK